MTKEQFYDRFEKMWHDLIGSPAQHTLRYSNCSGLFKEADEEIERLNRKVEQLEDTILKFANQCASAAEPAAPQCTALGGHDWKPAEQGHEYCVICQTYRRALNRGAEP